MVATELITGMEDIVQHIKDLEIKNKELQEENQTLHSEYHELNYIAFESGSSVEALEEENKKLKEEKDYLKINMEMENECLKAQNKKLKDEWDILNKFCSLECENNGQAVVDWICKFFKIEDDFCDLEKEHKKLKEENECVKRQIESVCKVNDKLKEKLANRRWKSFEDSESEEEEKEYAVEINVVGVGWCQYENEEERDRKVVYCKNGCWKIRGDKTAKDEEGNYCETDEEEEITC